MAEEELRLADLLAALSLSTDAAMGQEPEKAIRACILATSIARHLGVEEHVVADVYYTTLLKHLGCTATAHEELLLFGPDEAGMRPVAERLDVASARDIFDMLLITGRGAGIGRARIVARAMASAKTDTTSVIKAVCEVARLMAARLGLGDEVGRALDESLERWDGKGDPRKLRGEDIALPARIAEPATQAVIFHRIGGTEAVLAMMDRRAGGWFDPAVAEAFRSVGPQALDQLDREDPWAAVLDAEPEPIRRIPADRIDEIAGAFADMVDLKTPFTLGHSSGVADLASGAAARLGLTDRGSVRRAALLHDLGRIAVPNALWEKAGPLITSEWEQVRLHPYHTERILTRSVALAPLARIAGMHHERQDGSGYHHGAAAGEVPVEARVLAAADAFQAMTQDRPHRGALPAAEAAASVTAAARAGLFDPECVRAVVEEAGQAAGRVRGDWPANLTDREVEVLRWVTRGSSNRAIAAELVISPRTAEHHVQHIYDKIGVATRAGAAVFAMEHGLVR